MRAVVYEEFGQIPELMKVPDPTPKRSGVVLRVNACGICRSDWHGWMGNDADIKLPHIPGHEISGTVEETGAAIKHWKKGDRVTLPFVCGCGSCRQCASGNQQICDFQFQPGFTHWGAFAEFVAIEYADPNLVRIPDEIDFKTASGLGCRFITSFRAVVHQGNVSGGEWIAVHGCGGVGLSAIMIASALGANVIGVDISDEKLEFARLVGATAVINAQKEDVAEAVKEISCGGAHVSIDALGHPQTFLNSIYCLRKRGKHIQVGIMESGYRLSEIPINLVMARELELIGSHGMQAYKYPEMLEMICNLKLQPHRLIGKTVSLEESIDELVNMNSFNGTGVTVIDKF